MLQSYPNEGQRLAFVWERDGLAEAYSFAKRGYTVYRQARRTVYGKSYKRQLVLAAWEYRKFCRKALLVLKPTQ